MSDGRGVWITRRWLGLWISVSLFLALALGAVLLLAFWTPGGWRAHVTAEDRRRAIVRELARGSGAHYDSHPDPDVGRILVPERKAYPRDDIQVNRMGLRERDYELPKPAGRVRLVLLGDSFVYGEGVAAQERLGVHLERFLEERSGQADVEVLHVGVLSWNFRAEIAFLRRQLEALEPDLVIHVSLSNDLDDMSGVRGFGALADFSPNFRERANSLVYIAYPHQALGFRNWNHLPLGVEYESRTRYADARRRLGQLLDDLARSKGKPNYLHVAHWQSCNALFAHELAATVAAGELLYLPAEIWDAKDLLIPNDGHWNPRGHETVARILYGTIRNANLLPTLALQPWPEAEEEAQRIAAAGSREALGARTSAQAKSALEPAKLDDPTARQLFGGLDRDGRVSPYASLLLGHKPRLDTLVVQGRFLDDRVLTGQTVSVWVEEFELGQLTIQPGVTFEQRFPLRTELAARPEVNVRFVSDDWVYRDADLRKCVVFELERVALERGE